jgi:hypothetical protein
MDPQSATLHSSDQLLMQNREQEPNSSPVFPNARRPHEYPIDKPAPIADLKIHTLVGLGEGYRDLLWSSRA